MNVLLWCLVLAGGAALGFAFFSAVSGATLASFGGAALFPVAAFLVRLVIWALTR